MSTATARVDHAIATADAIAGQPVQVQVQATAESWATFRDLSDSEPEMLVAELLPSGCLAFIASRPKAGKTWLALSLAISVATGRPYLGRFAVPEPRPVLYIALEGTRAGIRARIGSMARGMGIDPDGDELAGLHLAYKPPGLNLGDAQWARWVVELAAELGVGLVIVDVLRRAANVREDNSGAQDFAQLLRGLDELMHDGRALVFLHHFGKASETNNTRTAGERMTGSGALHGAYDAALFITTASEGAREMTVEHDARDIASARPFDVRMTGDGTGSSGGYTYRDTCQLEWLGPPVDPADSTADQLRVILTADPTTSQTAAATQVGLGRTSAHFARAWARAHEATPPCVTPPAGALHTATQAEREMQLGGS